MPSKAGGSSTSTSKKETTNVKFRPVFPVSDMTPADAIDALTRTAGLTKRQADRVAKDASKAVGKVGDWSGLPLRLARVADSGASGAAAVKAARKSIRVWKRGRVDGWAETAAGVVADAAVAIGRAIGQTAEWVLEQAATPAGQGLINAALVSLGLPPAYSVSSDPEAPAMTADEAATETAAAYLDANEPDPDRPLYGAAAGAASGFAIGGPLGAAIGAAVGYGALGGLTADL